MKTLMLAVAALGVLSLTPRSTAAQSCCGELEKYLIDCQEDCGQMYVYGCNPQAGNTFLAPVSVQCGSFTYCNRVGSYAPAGNCLDGPAVSSSTIDANARSVDTLYVNAYVIDCSGRYVAVRMALDLELT
jgi:hypothetical protein